MQILAVHRLVSPPLRSSTLGPGSSALLGLAIASCVLAASPPAQASYLWMWTDQTSYELGEPIVVSLEGDPMGMTTLSVYTELLYSAPGLVDGTGAVATQSTITSFGGGLTWLSASPACEPDSCVVLDQIAPTGSPPPDGGLVTGTLTIPTVASGVLRISAGEDTAFFGAEIPSPVKVIIGGQEVDSLFDSGLGNINWSELALVTGCQTFSAGQVLSGGNSGAYRRTDRTCSGSFAPSRFYEWEVSDFDPALLPAGRSLALAYCEDGIALDLPADADIYSALAFWQSGTLFAGPPIPITSPTWVEQCQGLLVADDFDPILGSTPAPDFTSSGGTIRFGHLRWVEGSSPTTVAIADGIDNYSITFVPEPARHLGLVCGALALGVLGRRSSAGRIHSMRELPASASVAWNTARVGGAGSLR